MFQVENVNRLHAPSLSEEDGAVLKHQHDARYYYHLDDQHSTVGLTDEDGVLVEGYTYSPYGVPTIYNAGANGVVDWGFDDIVLQGGTSSLENRIMYTGRSWDEDTGLYYYRTRYMDPELGRFLAVDFIGTWGDPSGLGNGYVYVGNAPHDWTDPEGDCRWCKKALKKVADVAGDIICSGPRWVDKNTGDWLMEDSAQLSGYVDLSIGGNIPTGYVPIGPGADVGIACGEECHQWHAGANIGIAGFSGSFQRAMGPTYPASGPYVETTKIPFAGATGGIDRDGPYAELGIGWDHDFAEVGVMSPQSCR